MKIAHQILVIVVKDIVLCLVGTWLGAIVPGQRLSGTANKISVAITLAFCNILWPCIKAVCILKA